MIDGTRIKLRSDDVPVMYPMPENSATKYQFWIWNEQNFVPPWRTLASITASATSALPSDETHQLSRLNRSNTSHPAQVSIKHPYCHGSPSDKTYQLPNRAIFRTMRMLASTTSTVTSGTLSDESLRWNWSDQERSWSENLEKKTIKLKKSNFCLAENLLCDKIHYFSEGIFWNETILITPFHNYRKYCYFLCFSFMLIIFIS